MTQKKEDADIAPILIDIPLPIITPRLLLRPPQQGDGKALFEAKKDSATELKSWMLWAKNDSSEQDEEILVRNKYIDFLRREDLMLFAFDRARPDYLIAGTGLHRFDWKTRVFEIGYWVRTPDTGKGYATELTNALTRYAFEALGATKVTIGHADRNDKSRNVIQKLGFKQEGIREKEHLLPTDDLVDEYIYNRFDTKGLPDLNVSWGTE